jgi:hypothetical protein
VLTLSYERYAQQQHMLPAGFRVKRNPEHVAHPLHPGLVVVYQVALPLELTAQQHYMLSCWPEYPC